MNLRNKILLYLGLPFVLILILVAGINLYLSWHRMLDSAKIRIHNELDKAVLKIEQGNLESVTIPQIMAIAEENGLFEKREETLAFCKQILTEYPSLSAAYVNRENESQPTAIKKRHLENNTRWLVAEPYAHDSQHLMVEQSSPIFIAGKCVGIAGVDRNLNFLKEFIQVLKPFKSSSFFLFSENGLLIASTEKNHSKLEELFSETNNNFSAQSDIILVKTPKTKNRLFMAKQSIPTGNWTLVMMVSHWEIIQPLLKTFLITLSLSLLGLSVIVYLIYFLTNQIATRIEQAVTLAKEVAQGDLRAEVIVNSQDETGQLLQAIQDMILHLNHLIRQVKQSSYQLTSTATELSTTSRLQEKTIHEFGISSGEIAVAVKDISATSQELYHTMSNVAVIAHKTTNLADEGRSQLGKMEGSMQDLAESTRSISKKLSVINEKAHNINAVVTTISKVADQTNLLSLNAAIEAEKAGTYGLGFVVVAEEIRRLADQTAMATLDIEQMVQEMQGAVSSGVIEMDKFTEEVRSEVQEVAQISGHLEEIIEQVHVLSPRIEMVKEGMLSQTQGASQINEAMDHLIEGVQHTAASLQEFENATKTLYHSVYALQREISRFKTNEKT